MSDGDSPDLSEFSPHASDASADKEKARRKPLSCFEVWTIALAIIAIVVAGGTGVAIYWQDKIASRTLSELQRQYPKLTESADAAKSASTLAWKQFEATSAAVLSFGEQGRLGRYFFPETRQVIFNLWNVGHMSATQVRGSVTISLETIPGNQVVWSQRVPITCPDIHPVLSNGPSNNGVCTLRYSYPDDGQVQNGMEAVTADLSFSYSNGFETIKDGGCYAHVGFSIPIRKAGSASETAGYEGPDEVLCAALQNIMPGLVEQRDAAYRRRAEGNKPN